MLEEEVQLSKTLPACMLRLNVWSGTCCCKAAKLHFYTSRLYFLLLFVSMPIMMSNSSMCVWSTILHPCMAPRLTPRVNSACQEWIRARQGAVPLVYSQQVRELEHISGPMIKT